MTHLFYAQPYDSSAEGFYFRRFDEYSKQAANAKNQYGDVVEEFELQFIEGDQIDSELAKAWRLNQANIERFIAVADEWDQDDKFKFILAVRECGCSFDPETVKPWEFGIECYRAGCIRELATMFVDECLFGEQSQWLLHHIDYDGLAKDLSIDYSEAIIAGERVFYLCG